VKGNRWLLVALLSVTATASYLCRVNVSVAGALLMSEFNLSQVEMGRVFSAFLLGYALFMVPAGMLADRWGAKRVLALAAWSWVFATLLQAGIGWGPLKSSSTGAMLAFLAVRFLLGIGEAPTFPGAGQGVSRWIPPEKQGRATGLVNAAIGLGSALAPPLVSFVMVRAGWRAALLVTALPALAVAIAWQKVKDPEPESKPGLNETANARKPAGLKRLRSRSFYLLTASYTLQGYVGYIFVFWFYLYLTQERHFDLLRGALLSSLPWILSLASIPLGGWLSDRLVRRYGLTRGRRIVPLVGLAGAGVFLALGAHTGSAYMAAAYLALSTALVLCVEGPFWATMMEMAGGNSGTAGGIMNMGSNVGGLISPALTPMLAVWIGWENALLLAAGISIAGGLLWFGISIGPEETGEVRLTEAS
jgi:MFS transporter, ACS family, glucarate transporter